MSEKNGFKIKDRPASYHSGKYFELLEALLKLPDGKAVCIPLDQFNSNPVSNLGHSFKPKTPRILRCRKLPDGWYLWLEPEQKEQAQ